MSSHCNRYPNCGCRSDLGTKCHLPDGDPRLQEKEKDTSGSRPFTMAEKQAELEKWERQQRGASGKIKRKHATNYTPPKKRHRKKK